MEESPPVIIRRSVRHDVSMRATLRVASEHTGSVRFTSAAGAKDGWIECDMVDLSSGGLGVMSGFLVPRRCVVLVRVFGLEAGAGPILEVPCRVQRICMTDRRPAYLIGTSFEAMSATAAEGVNALLTLLSEAA